MEPRPATSSRPCRGLAGYYYGLVAVFALMAGMALMSIVSVMLIRPEKTSTTT